MRAAATGLLATALALTLAVAPASAARFGRPQTVTSGNEASSVSAAAGPSGTLHFAFTEISLSGPFTGRWTPGSPPTTPEPIPGDRSQPVYVVTSPRGHTAVAWVESHSGSAAIMHRIRVATSAPGEPELGPPVTVADFADDSFIVELQVGVADDGTVVLAWTEPRDDHTRRALLAVRPGTGEFGRPLEVSGEAAAVLDPGPQLAVAADGTAVVAWAEQSQDGGRVMARTVGAGAASPAEQVSAPGSEAEYSFRLGANPAGDAVLAWVARKGRRRTMAMVLGDTRRGFADPVGVSNGPNARGAAVAVSSRGDAGVAWVEGPLGEKRSVRLFGIRANGRTEAVGRIARGRVNFPRLAIDGRGRPAVLWQTGGGLDAGVAVAAGDRAWRFSRPRTVARPVEVLQTTALHASGPRTVALALHNGGTAEQGGRDVLYGSVRERSGRRFERARVVRRTRAPDLHLLEPPLLAFGGGGGLVAVWHEVSRRLEVQDRLVAAVLRP